MNFDRRQSVADSLEDVPTPLLGPGAATLGRRKPISTYTVARWMGHGGTSLVNRT